MLFTFKVFMLIFHNINRSFYKSIKLYLNRFIWIKNTVRKQMMFIYLATADEFKSLSEKLLVDISENVVQSSG